MSDKFIKIGIAACAVVIVYLSWDCVTYKKRAIRRQSRNIRKIREIKAKTFILKEKNRNMDMICRSWTALTI